MILLVDNTDSFVYNLARYVRDLGEEAVVRRSANLSVAEVKQLAPSHIILSPGPGTPRDAGCSVDLVRRLGHHVPILGVCLGHQCIAAAYGVRVVRAKAPRHGMSSRVSHRDQGLFRGIPSPFQAARYHSLVIDPASIYGDLEVTATSEDGVIMGVRHRRHPVEGIQFHPESILTEYGYHMLHRFIRPDQPVASDIPTAADWRHF